MLIICHVTNQDVHSLCIPVTSTNKTLRCGSISIPSVWCQKGSQMAVIWMYGYRMIPMPIVKDRFNSVARHRCSYVKG